MAKWIGRGKSIKGMKFLQMIYESVVVMVLQMWYYSFLQLYDPMIPTKGYICALTR